MTLHVVIHGHFYQPPREDPWLETVEHQPSAAPYHDWNERITDECYARNVAARILDEQGRITSITNTFSSISFDVGPTLMAWLARHAPQVHEGIVAADHAAGGDGHGPAMAQAYNHVIMPLATPRDRRTQVAWGIADFEHRFGRRPEGMWLPETAVDLDTLEALADEGIAFTVLEPGQARRVRPPGATAWTTPEPLDPSRPYVVRLPTGRAMTVFFYDGAVSRAVAFEDLLADGATFVRRILDAAPPDRDEPRLISIATDGESYGHHHRHGEMALAFAIQHLAAADDVELTSYGRFLAGHPPTWEVELREDTSWSCPHGVERWRDHCGCADGGHPGWDQRWRRPLRAALEWLREQLDAGYAACAEGLLIDPWAARDGYLAVLLDPASRGEFLERHAARPLDEDGRRTALGLLELQRTAQLMFTSCGWFFDDLARIETIQILRYAARALDLARDLLGDDLEPEFLDRLAEARSNERARGDGRQVWLDEVVPARSGPRDVAAAAQLAPRALAGIDALSVEGQQDVVLVHDDRTEQVHTVERDDLDLDPDDLPPELRRRVVTVQAGEAADEAGRAAWERYRRDQPTLRRLVALQMPVPAALRRTAQIALGYALTHRAADDPGGLVELLRAATALEVHLDDRHVRACVVTGLTRLVGRAVDGQGAATDAALTLLTEVRQRDLHPDLSAAQDLVAEATRAGTGGTAGTAEHLHRLADALGLAIPQP